MTEDLSLVHPPTEAHSLLPLAAKIDSVNMFPASNIMPPLSDDVIESLYSDQELSYSDILSC